MPATNQAEIEDAIMAIITAIYSSDKISDEQKDAYVSQIEKEGFNEELLKELEDIIGAEQAELEQELADKQQLKADMEQELAEETKTNDQPQAEILAAVENYTKQQEQVLKSEMDELEQTVDESFERATGSAEQSEADAIRAKLGLK